MGCHILPVSSRILAFRPSSAVERLAPRSEACPLSTRELLGPAAAQGRVLPVVHATLGAVAKGALVAAKELQGVLGLSLPQDAAPEAWFDAVTRAADEVAPGSPIFLCAEVLVAGEDAMQVERAVRQAWRLVKAGITHLAIDVGAIAPTERGRVIAEVADAGVQHGLCVEVIVPLSDGSQAARRAATLFEELGRGGTPVDLASVRCRAPETRDEARLQAAALARISQTLAGVPVMRRGVTSAELVQLLRGSPVKLCDDGGAVSARAAGDVAPAPGAAGDAAGARGSPLERAAAELPPDAIERIEARAYVEALEFMEGLGARGSAVALARALEQRLGP
jgi:hypothetical protein